MLAFPELEDVELELELQVRTAGGFQPYRSCLGTGERQGVSTAWTVRHGCNARKTGGQTANVHANSK